MTSVGNGCGEIVTVHGGYFKELLIVEKKKDGEPFELHTDLTDKLSLYKRIRNACLWSFGIFIMSYILLIAVIVFGVFAFASGNFGTYSSGSALMLSENSGRIHWNATYSKFNGFRRRSVSLNEGTHTVTIEIVTNSGELSGTVYYDGSALPTSTFDVNIAVSDKDKVKLRVGAKVIRAAIK